MAATVESAWPRYPDYRIDLIPCPGTAQVWAGDILVAESDRCLVVRETRHVDRLYIPEAGLRWEVLQETDHRSVCPFKGQAGYWSVTGLGGVGENVVWSYSDPFPEVAGIRGYFGVYHERLRVVVRQRWPDGSEVGVGFPLWGDAADLVRLIDVEPAGEHRFRSPAFGETERNVVEGGQLLAQAVVAAAKAVPDQRVISASMVFSKAAAFDLPLDLGVDVLRRGRSFSAVEVRAEQDGQLRSAGLVLTDRGAPDVIRGAAEMPGVPGPEGSVPFEGFGLTGREIRIVDAAYDRDPQRLGPAEIHAWTRFRDAPGRADLHAALATQSITHWTIAAAMRPHPGISEADAHVTLSTGIMQASIAFHDEVDVTEWLLYANQAIWSGRGLAQGEGRVFAADGRMVASYTVQAMIREFEKAPASMGRDLRSAM